MSIQSSINATVGAITGAAVYAKKTAMDKAKAAQAELEQEKKLQLKRSEAAAKLAQARVEQDQKEKQKQREDIVKRIQKYGKEAPVDIPRLGKEAQAVFLKDFLEKEKLSPAQALEKLGVNNGKK